MSDRLRDAIPYFRTWLTLTDTKLKGWNRDQAEHVKELEGKVESAQRFLRVAKEQRCPDLATEFADIAVQLQERLEAAKEKQKLLDDE